MSEDNHLMNKPKRKKRNFDNSIDSQFSSIFSSPSSARNLQSRSSDCEHYLKIGCNSKSFSDYSIYKKCHFNEINNRREQEAKFLSKKDLRYLNEDSGSFRYQASLLSDQNEPNLPVIESESNRICLAYWPINYSKTKGSQSDEHLNDLDEFYEDYDELNENDSNDESLEISYAVLTKSANSETFSITCSVSLSKN